MVEEDFQAWTAFPENRRYFNKLDFALRMGYDAGPTGVPISKQGYYIIRPTYNLYGMGIGASILYLDPKKDSKSMIELSYVPPGYFWCEYLHGTHFSIDLKREKNKWVPFSSMAGYHEDTNDLVKFEYWDKVENPQIYIPDFIHKEITKPKIINLESKGKNIFEVHLRSGNDHMWEYPIGTRVFPVWNKENREDISHLPFVKNMNEDSFAYSASGRLHIVRLGYRVKLPE